MTSLPVAPPSAPHASRPCGNDSAKRLVPVHWAHLLLFMTNRTQTGALSSWSRSTTAAESGCMNGYDVTLARLSHDGEQKSKHRHIPKRAACKWYVLPQATPAVPTVYYSAVPLIRTVIAAPPLVCGLECWKCNTRASGYPVVAGSYHEPCGSCCVGGGRLWLPQICRPVRDPRSHLRLWLLFYSSCRNPHRPTRPRARKKQWWTLSARTARRTHLMRMPYRTTPLRASQMRLSVWGRSCG